MKKILALVLCFALCFSLCACGGKEEKNANAGNGIDLAAAVTSGKIPELNVSLGMTPDEVKVAYNYDPEAQGETGFYIMEGDNDTYFLTDLASFYYKTDNEDKGISAIICRGTVFGMMCNNYEKPEDVKNAFPDIKFQEGNIEESDFYFHPYLTEDCVKLSYQSGAHKVDFLFMDDQLIAVNLIDTENWSE